MPSSSILPKRTESPKSSQRPFFHRHHKPTQQRAVLNITQLIKAVMSSAAETELDALFINAHKAVPMHQLLAEMGHI